MSKFIGRQYELSRLHELLDKKTASFVVIKGRRRIGKSRLIEEFGKSFSHFYQFSGLPPEPKITKQDQLDEFSRQLAKQFHLGRGKYTDWGDIFQLMHERVRTGRTLILFDELSWMGSKDHTFLGQVKNLWDLYLKQNDQLVFIVCSSASGWIEKNILSSTGFVGRISLTLTLNELSLAECNFFFSKHASAYEKFKILSVTGGVPKYLEEILPKQSAEENITRLCFRKEGFLFDEFNRIFSDIFMRKSDYYRKILTTLVDGPKELSIICHTLKIEHHGRIREYLEELELAGFIRKDYIWHFQSGVDTDSKQYRLSDNYLRFYLNYVEKNYQLIQRNAFTIKSLGSLPQWSTMMGLQFENIILSNRPLLHKALNLRAEMIRSENPFFQKKTARHQACQIDYLIQTHDQTLYVCEIKFSKNSIGADVIKEVQEKIKRLKRPKSFSCRPVLIHVNGVTQDLIDENYFSDIIDMTQWLE